MPVVTNSRSPQFEIVERPGRLVIRVRWMSRMRGVAMLAILLPFLGLLIWLTDHKPGIVVLSLVLSFPAVMFAPNWYCLTATPGEVRTSRGPVPIFFGRRTVYASEIQEVSCRRVRAVAGRGGVMERYTLQADTRAGGKSFRLLDAESEADIRAAAEALVGWLNANRATNLRPVWLTSRC